MPIIPEKRVIIKDFSGGINSYAGADELRENEFPLMENYVIRAAGNIPGLTKRNGFQRYNTNQFDGNSSILSIEEFTQTGQDSKLIVNNSAGTPELGICSTPFTGSFTTLANAAKYGYKLRHVAIENRDYIHNINNGAGASEIFYYDSIKAQNILLEMGLPPCPQTFTIANGKSGAGSLTTARAYLITFIYNDKYESGIIPISENSPDYKVLTPANEPGTGSLLLQNIPTGNQRVTGRKIYATKQWTVDGVTVFYYLDTIYDNSTTEYEDITSDDDLQVEMDPDVLYKPRAFGAKYAGTMNSRLFLGDVTETQYTAPTDTSVVLANSGTVAGLHLNKQAKYTYKFAYLFYNLNGSTPNWVTVATIERLRWTNYSGIYSALSAGKSHTLPTPAADNSIDLTDIDTIASDSYAGQRIITFRNLAFSVYDVATGVTTRLIKDGTANHTSELKGFKVGDKVLLEGGTGGFAALNGTHTVTAVDASGTYIDINYDSSAIGGAYTTHEIKAQGQNWYALQISYYGDTTPNVFDFTDELPDYDGAGEDLVTKSTSVLNESGKGVVVPSNGNQRYSSRIYYSEEGVPDHIKSTNYFDMYSEDGDAITGLYCGDDGVIAVKDNNYTKLYSTSKDPRQWERRKVVTGWGGSDGLMCETPEGLVIIKTASISDQPITIYLWSGGGIPAEIDLNLRKYIQALTSAGTVTINDVKYDRLRNWVWVLATYTDDASNTYDMAFVYDMVIKKWYPFINRNARLGLISAADTRNFGMIFGNSSGYLVKYDWTLYKDKLGTSHSDAAIVSRIRTKSFKAEGELVFKMFRADIDTVGGTPSGNTIALKYKTESISEQSINLNYTNSANSQRLRNRTFTNARNGSYREVYVGLEDSNTTFGHVLKGIYLDMDIRHSKRIGR